MAVTLHVRPVVAHRQGSHTQTKPLAAIPDDVRWCSQGAWDSGWLLNRYFGSKREGKQSGLEKNMSRAEKRERAHAKEAADAKWKKTMEAVKEFKERREAEKKPPSSPSDGSKSSGL